MLASEKVLRHGLGTASDMGFVDDWDRVVPHHGPVHEGVRYPFLSTGRQQTAIVFDETKTWRTYTTPDGVALVIDFFPGSNDDRQMPTVLGGGPRGAFYTQEASRRRAAFLSRHTAYLVWRAGDEASKRELVTAAMVALKEFISEHPEPVKDEQPARPSIGVSVHDRTMDGFLE